MPSCERENGPACICGIIYAAGDQYGAGEAGEKVEVTVIEKKCEKLSKNAGLRQHHALLARWL